MSVNLAFEKELDAVFGDFDNAAPEKVDILFFLHGVQNQTVVNHADEIGMAGQDIKPAGFILGRNCACHNLKIGSAGKMVPDNRNIKYVLAVHVIPPNLQCIETPPRAPSLLFRK